MVLVTMLAAAAVAEPPQPHHVLIRSTRVVSADGRRDAAIYLHTGYAFEWYCPAIDGQMQRGWSAVRGPVFTPDSASYAYFGEDSNGWKLVLNGGEQPLEIAPDSPPIFLPDARTVAYWARHVTRSNLVVDGVPHPKFDRVVRDSLAFSDDARHAAYIAQVNSYWVLVVDGQVMLADRLPTERPRFERSLTGRWQVRLVSTWDE